MIDPALVHPLTAVPADVLVAAVADHLGEEWGSVRVLLVDHAQRALRQVHPRPATREDAVDGPVDDPVDDSWTGRGFASQQVLFRDHEGRREVLLPLTTRGQRLGVVVVDGDVDGVPPERWEERQDDLLRAVALLALALVASEKLTTVREDQRRRRPMTVAAELQWALLPGAAYQDEEASVAGLLEPAYSTAGDAYDWSRDDDVLTVAVLEGGGRGVGSSLATTLALSALRNARVGGASLAEQCARADQAVHTEYGGTRHVAALVLTLDLRTGAVSVVDAGSPALYQVRGGWAERVELERQLPLGMFEETVYREQHLTLEPGDRLVIVSEGLYGGALTGGGTLATGRLDAYLREGRLLAAPELVRSLVRALEMPAAGLEDDAVAVCVDWRR